MEIPEVNIELKTVCVEPRVVKTKWKIIQGTPVFGMCKSARKAYGIHTLVGYWLWQFKMKRLWKHNSKKD